MRAKYPPAQPVTAAALRPLVPDPLDPAAVLDALQRQCATRGVVLIEASAATSICSSSSSTTVTCSSGSGVVIGGVTLGLGIAAIIGGAIMISVGGKRVPITPTDALLHPKLQLGPTGGSLNWAF